MHVQYIALNNAYAVYSWTPTGCSVEHDGTESRSLKGLSWQASSEYEGREGGVGHSVGRGGVGHNEGRGGGEHDEGRGGGGHDEGRGRGGHDEGRGGGGHSEGRGGGGHNVGRGS